MMIFVVIFINQFSKSVVVYDSKRTLSTAMNEHINDFSIIDGEVVLEDEFVREEDKIYFLILEEGGSVLEGEYPEGFSGDPPVEAYVTRKMTIGGTEYYVRDVRKKGRINNSRIYLRGVVQTKDIFSRYKVLVYISYVIIASIYFIAIAIGVFFAREISKSLYEMMQTAENMGGKSNEWRRMEYKGRYRELQVLVQANNRMLDRMEEQIRQQEQFASDVAHELRTPVAVVLAQCEYVKEHPDAPEEQGAAFELIYRQAQKVSLIITQLLYLSRIEQGRMQLQAEEVDLIEIVESVCEDEQEKAENAVLIRKNLSSAETRADINLIAIAIQNLIMNAIKFSVKGGVIEVSCGQQGEEVFVKIRDYGRGMEQEELEHIFERFYKADKSRNSEGFGLGLSITQKIVEINHGTIEATSSPGKGSTFILKFPANN